MIDEKAVANAETVRKKYADGKKNLEERIVSEEQVWKLQRWQGYSGDAPKMPSSAPYMWNAIVNRHADMMDNLPKATFLPRERSDEEAAKTLSSVVPVILERCGFEKVYSDAAWYKLKHGVSCLGVFWNPNEDSGAGDITIKPVDILNLFWQPGIDDIQKSRNLFICAAVNKEELEETYPDVDLTGGSAEPPLKEYIHSDTVDRSDQLLVVDWYYKKKQGGKSTVHLCKYCQGKILYSSENDEEYSERGFYDHGLYPVVIDTLYPEADSISGYGIIAVTLDTQTYIDKFDALTMDYAKKILNPRWFIKKSAGVNKAEFKDESEPFITFEGDLSEEKLSQLKYEPISGTCYSLLDRKVNELKETIGNRDVNSGGTGSGVTSGAAIATLQEAGNKLARDTIRGDYRAFTKMTELILELIRQFYTEERTFRITGSDSTRAEYVSFSNEALSAKPVTGVDGEKMTSYGEVIKRKLIFDISIKAEKTNPYSTLSQNETASNLYSMGALDPENAEKALIMLSMMSFDGKSEIEEKIKKNAEMYSELMNMKERVSQLEGMLYGASGVVPERGGTPPTGGGTVTPDNDVRSDYAKKLVERANNSVKEGVKL